MAYIQKNSPFKRLTKIQRGKRVLFGQGWLDGVKDFFGGKKQAGHSPPSTIAEKRKDPRYNK